MELPRHRIAVHERNPKATREISWRAMKPNYCSLTSPHHGMNHTKPDEPSRSTYMPPHHTLNFVKPRGCLFYPDGLSWSFHGNCMKGRATDGPFIVTSSHLVAGSPMRGLRACPHKSNPKAASSSSSHGSLMAGLPQSPSRVPWKSLERQLLLRGGA